MAKKKKAPAKTASRKVTAPLGLREMFSEGLKQDMLVLSDIERTSLAIIMEKHRIRETAVALRFAVAAEAELCRAGRSAKPKKPAEPKPKKNEHRGPGRPPAVDGGYKYPFPFRVRVEDTAAINEIMATHGVQKSTAIRHAINCEAARCVKSE
jgi:hypothetical protein